MSTSQSVIVIPGDLRLCRTAIETMIAKPAQKGKIRRKGGQEVIGTSSSWDGTNWHIIPSDGDQATAVQIPIDDIDDVALVSDREYYRLQSHRARSI